jgi:hypothetical protein
MNWQSIRSVMPPCPGILSPKSLILKARLRPLAKNPPKGAMREAKVARTKMWNWIGATTTESGIGTSFPNEWMKEGGTLNSRGTKTGLGVQSKPDQAETPRSCKPVRFGKCDGGRKRGGYGNRTDHVLVLGEDIGYSTANDNCTNPSSNEPLDSLFGRKTDKRGFSPNHAANICKDIICNDETDRKKEPNQPLENRVDDEMSLENDEKKSHMRPTELRELIGIRPRRQRHHKKHKS